jgi:hypothetical protein
MYIEIKNRFTGEIILCGEYESIKDCLEKNRTASLDGASLNRASLDGASLDGASLDGASLDGASLNGASLDGASLDGASLNGASLHWASLDRASLDGASLDGASLDGASLNGASGITLPIITISGSMHTVCYYNGKIRIGCENHTVAKWKKDYKKIGKANKYTDEQISEYKRYIDACIKLGGA